MTKLSIYILSIFWLHTVSAQVRPVTQLSTPSSIEEARQKLVEDPSLKNASISFYVYDVTGKKVIDDYYGDHSLVTASTMKVVTTATALQYMGSYHKFKTKLAYTGYIDSNCVLHGDIYIEGGGDPTLGSRFFDKKEEDFMLEWVDAIKELGILEINGRIIGDDSYFSDEFVPSTWGWGDMGNYYGAGVSGLSIYDNTTHFSFNSGPENNDPTEIECYEPYVPGLTIDNRVLAGNTKSDEAYIYGGPYDSYRLVKGRIPKGETDFVVKGATHDPALVAAFELESKLWQAGVKIKGTATTTRALEIIQKTDTTKRVEFLEKSSPSLSSIVYWTNLISNNLFAEHLLMHIGKEKYHNGSVFSGTAAVEDYWKGKGVDMAGFYMNDGSGLSRANAISSKQLVEILTYMKSSSKYFDTFYSSLPNCGKSGTLSSYGRGTKIYNNLRAKSGTMTRVKSYAGYVTSADGKELVFGIIVNNFNCTTSQMGKKLEKLMISMGDYRE